MDSPDERRLSWRHLRVSPWRRTTSIWFLKISPDNKIPAIVDSEGPDGKPISVFESGAIPLYLAGKTGKFQPGRRSGRPPQRAALV